MEINKSANWRIPDPCPGQSLAEVEPVSLRARTLLARKLDHPSVCDDFVKFAGVVDMLAALDYHYSHLAQYEVCLADYLAQVRGPTVRQMTSEEARCIECARYEALAYLSALGRFRYFARASTVETPTIDRLMVFRHKAAAHRSIDMPRGESPELQSLHALSLASAGGQLFKPVQGRRLGLHYQIQRLVGQVEDFVPEEDHGQAMAEAYNVLEDLLK